MSCRVVSCGAVLCFCCLGVFVVHHRLLMVRCTTDTSVCVSRNDNLPHIGSNSGTDPVRREKARLRLGFHLRCIFIIERKRTIKRENKQHARRKNIRQSSIPLSLLLTLSSLFVF